MVDVVVEDELGAWADAEAAARWVEDWSLRWVTVAATNGDWVQAWGNVNDSETFLQHSYTIVNSNGTVAWRRDGFTSATADDIIEALADID